MPKTHWCPAVSRPHCHSHCPVPKLVKVNCHLGSLSGSNTKLYGLTQQHPGSSPHLKHLPDQLLLQRWSYGPSEQMAGHGLQQGGGHLAQAIARQGDGKMILCRSAFLDYRISMSRFLAGPALYIHKHSTGTEDKTNLSGHLHAQLPARCVGDLFFGLKSLLHSLQGLSLAARSIAKFPIASRRPTSN